MGIVMAHILPSLPIFANCYVRELRGGERASAEWGRGSSGEGEEMPGRLGREKGILKVG
jgi:hypothetical protein